MTENNLEQFARTELMLGKAGLQKLQNSFVVVVGIGAVGGYAVEGLARAGVGKIRVVDFDEVAISNINRQLLATHSTIGKSKAELARDRVLDINPNCNVEAVKKFMHVETADEILAGEPDFVVDAIDSLNPKVELLVACDRLQLPVISSMGAALRNDFTKIKIGKLAKTYNCPLARRVRKYLKKRNVSMKIPCIYSTEPVAEKVNESILPDEKSEDNAYDRGRKRRTLGSMPTITGIFGLAIANYIINTLTED